MSTCHTRIHKNERDVYSLVNESMVYIFQGVHTFFSDVRAKACPYWWKWLVVITEKLYYWTFISFPKLLDLHRYTCLFIVAIRLSQAHRQTPCNRGRCRCWSGRTIDMRKILVKWAFLCRWYIFVFDKTLMVSIVCKVNKFSVKF